MTAMNAFLGLSPNFPILYIIPLAVFGPIFLLVLYHLGLKEIINPSPETRANIELRKEEEKRQAEDHQNKMSKAGLDKSGYRHAPLQWLGQAATYVVFAVGIAYFSNSPAYQAHPSDMAAVRLSFTHPPQRKEECHKRTWAELQKLAPNMRAPMDCSRERWPLVVDLSIDGVQVFHGASVPAGQARDGHSSFYEKFQVSAGRHRVVVRLRDRGGETRAEYDYTEERSVDLKAAEILVIGFSNASARITFTGGAE
ncbi:MAG: hypothetical protein HQ504_05985 [Rhodospirillaceae bacterium]|nr:hypothetical protein [Rhodospirillaceae bacterium]